MDHFILAADDDLLRKAFGDLLGPAPAMHEIDAIDPFQNKVTRAMVPVASVDLDLVSSNSWQVDSSTGLIELALGCTSQAATAELELVAEGDSWMLMSVSAAATRALIEASPGTLGEYSIVLEPGQRLYVFAEGW